MNILQISSVPINYPGGTEKVVWEISKRLAKKHKVTILQTDLYLPQKEGISVKEGVKIITIKNKFFFGGYGYSKKAITWLKNNWQDYDIIHCHGYNRFLTEFALYHLKKKVHLIFTPHGFIHTKKNYLFKIVHDLTLGRFIKNANICTALTKLDFKEYEKLGVKKEKIVEIPNGVDIKNFSRINKKEIKKIKKERNLKKTLLYVGRIHKSKGLQYVIKILKDLDCKFLIVGKDENFKKNLIKLSEKENVKDKVIFLKDIGDESLINIYHASDIFVLFSEWEGFGIVVIEAMAAGKPVVVSNRGALPFIVKNGESGFIIPFKNIKMLKEKINFLLLNKKERDKMGKRGKKFSKKYSWEKIADKFEEIYRKVIGA